MFPSFSTLRWVAILLGTTALVAQPTLLAPEYTVVRHNPHRDLYVEGPGLVRMSDGGLVSVVPVIPRDASPQRRVKDCTTYIGRSSDGGRTWETISTLPYYSCVPWTQGDAVYLFAMKGGLQHRNDDLLLLRSRDGGRTWSAPVTLFKGHFWNCHTGMVQRDGKLYWAIDDLALGAKRGPVAVVGDLTRDPMDPAAWRLSNRVPFPGVPSQLAHPKFENLSSQYLEPNVKSTKRLPPCSRGHPREKLQADSRCLTASARKSLAMSPKAMSRSS